MEKVPNFLIVGAAKAGTTSLFHYLNQHPDVYIPTIKECRFFSQMPRNQKGLGAEKFANEGVRDWNEYKKLFAGRREKALGDISNDYLYYYETSIKNIKKYLGEKVKIIIILRNPIDRAYSNYLHAVREGWENLSFEEALEKEEERIKNGWTWPYHYVKVGMYYEQVKAYIENFKNIKIYLYEDLENIQNFMESLFLFLEVEPLKLNFNRHYNISGYPKNRIIHYLLTKDNIFKKILRPLFRKFLPEKIREDIRFKIMQKNLKKMSMKKETRRKLVQIYRDDILKLQELVKRDLSMWLSIE